MCVCVCISSAYVSESEFFIKFFRLLFFFIQRQLLCNIIQVTGIHYNDSQFLNVTFNLQLKNIGCIPCVVQYTFVTYFMHTRFHFRVPYSSTAPPSSNHQFVLYICEFPSFLLYSLVVVVQWLNRARLLQPYDYKACQALLSMGFSRQAYWSGLPLHRYILQFVVFSRFHI